VGEEYCYWQFTFIEIACVPNRLVVIYLHWKVQPF
jgi:hypothetical protein